MRPKKFSIFPSYEAFEKLERTSKEGVAHRSGGGRVEQRLTLLSNQKVYSLTFLIGIVGLVLIVTAFRLQVIEHASLLQQAKQNSTRQIIYHPPRGIIYDRNGKVLAKNIPHFELVLDTSLVPPELEIPDFLNSLSFQKTIPLLPLDSQISKDRYVVVASSDEYEKGIAFRSFAAEHNEFSLVIKAKRYYPFGETLSHVLGYVGKFSPSDWKEAKAQGAIYSITDEVGKTGIEKQFEEVLKGERGVKTIETNALGQAVRLIEEREPQQLGNITLTIDADLQQALFRALEGVVRVNGGSGGAVLVSNASTGEILAITSSPSFDNNMFIGGEDQEIEALLNSLKLPLFFRALSGEYPSGSIIKPIFALAALEEKIITDKTIIESSGGIQVGDFFFPDWKEGGHGRVNIVHALSESVNTFFYYIGGGYEKFKGLGVERLGKYARIFGLGSHTGVTFGAEKEGFIPTPEWKERVKKDRWYIGDTYHLAIGQGDLLVTPVQMLQMIASFSQEGKTAKLRIAKTEAESSRMITLDKKSFQIVNKALREVVESGSARALNDVGVSVAGKTGTAEVGSGKPHAWFVGFLPYEKPKFAFVVLIENGGEGSMAAVPVARQVVFELKRRYSL